MHTSLLRLFKVCRKRWSGMCAFFLSRAFSKATGGWRALFVNLSTISYCRIVLLRIRNDSVKDQYLSAATFQKNGTDSCCLTAFGTSDILSSSTTTAHSSVAVLTSARAVSHCKLKTVGDDPLAQ